MATVKDFADAQVIPWDEGSQEPFLVGHLLGVEAALEALEDHKLPDLAGIRVARYVLTSVLNGERISRLAAAHRFAVKNGVDLTTHDVASGAAGIHVRTLDLVDRVEAEAPHA